MAADIAPMPTKEIVSPVPVLNPWTFSAAKADIALTCRFVR
jgi:hypothetical protein